MHREPRLLYRNTAARGAHRLTKNCELAVWLREVGLLYREIQRRRPHIPSQQVFAQCWNSAHSAFRQSTEF